VPATRDALRAARTPRILAFTVAAVGAGTTLALVDPAKTSVYPPCPFHALTGLWCPGCGTLRGLHQLLTGDPAAAFGRNPLMVLTVALLATMLLASLARAVGVLRRPPPPLPVAVPWIVFGVVVAFGVLRNIPAEPFSALAP
jgi:hypothetical protein